MLNLKLKSHKVENLRFIPVKTGLRSGAVKKAILNLVLFVTFFTMAAQVQSQSIDINKNSSYYFYGRYVNSLSVTSQPMFIMNARGSAPDARIGVFTNSPSYRFHINSDIDFKGARSINNVDKITGNGAWLRFRIARGSGNDAMSIGSSENVNIYNSLYLHNVNSKLGIGTNNPAVSLDVRGSGVFTGDISGAKGTFSGDIAGVKGTFSGNVSGVAGTFSGNVSGVNATFNNLTLNVGSFPDYVFAKSYNLMPLEQVEAYIKANHHLPNVPKAAKIEKEGMNVAQINVLLMEKVEELTLHTIEQHKQIKAQNQQMKALMQRLEKLEKARK